MRTEGMPHSPKPPTASEAPFGMSAMASWAFVMTLSNGSCFLISLSVHGRGVGTDARWVVLEPRYARGSFEVTCGGPAVDYVGHSVGVRSLSGAGVLLWAWAQSLPRSCRPKSVLADRLRPRPVLPVRRGGPDHDGRSGSPGPVCAAPPVLLRHQVIGVGLDEQFFEHRVHGVPPRRILNRKVRQLLHGLL